jgi:hypothetical protein
MTNPYSGLKDYQFWRRSVSAREVHLFDPVVHPRFRIEPSSKVATAGSCFAQHISRRLSGIGFNYYTPEDGGDLSPAEKRRRNYGVFSARFGNIYTTAQLRQLFDEAFGRHQPAETHFIRPDGRLVDACRQQVEPDGFATLEALQADRRAHLAAVREMFEQADVFVFTLGLTEAWRSRIDGSVFPIAPGVVGGAHDPERHEFVNFGVSEVDAELEAFLQGLRSVNPKVKVLLTVSPVPLIATYEDRNVLVSTTYSKSVLRVVAEMAVARHEWVDYFPSYEIITGSYAGGLYYEEDDREVNALGVAHVMRSFLKNYTAGRETSSAGSGDRASDGASDRESRPTAADIARTNAAGIVCDEEVLAAARGG